MKDFKTTLDDVVYDIGTGCIMGPFAIVIIGALVTCVCGLAEYIGEQPWFPKWMVIVSVILYVLIRLAILAVKILVPYYIMRFLIDRYDWSRALYTVVAAVAVVALVTDGSPYRKYRKENPEFVERIKIEVDEGAPGYQYLIADIISYEGGRMIYDLETSSKKMDEWQRRKIEEIKLKPQK